MRFLLPLIILALTATSAHAYPQLPDPLPPVEGNPADRLLDIAIEDFRCDRATKCAKRTKPGVVAMTEWLQANVRGVSGARTAARSGGRTPPRCTPRTAPSTGTSTPP